MSNRISSLHTSLIELGLVVESRHHSEVRPRELIRLLDIEQLHERGVAASSLFGEFVVVVRSTIVTEQATQTDGPRGILWYAIVPMEITQVRVLLCNRQTGAAIK